MVRTRHTSIFNVFVAILMVASITILTRSDEASAQVVPIVRDTVVSLPGDVVAQVPQLPLTPTNPSTPSNLPATTNPTTPTTQPTTPTNGQTSTQPTTQPTNPITTVIQQIIPPTTQSTNPVRTPSTSTSTSPAQTPQSTTSPVRSSQPSLNTQTNTPVDTGAAARQVAAAQSTYNPSPAMYISEQISNDLRTKLISLAGIAALAGALLYGLSFIETSTGSKLRQIRIRHILPVKQTIPVGKR